MVRTYKDHLRFLDEPDFVEACDRIIFLDEWFPSIARIRAMTGECGKERRERQRKHEARLQAKELASRDSSLTCPLCHGARWMRTGQWLQGEAEMRPCQACTFDGRHDARRESVYIARHGGVPVVGTGHIQQADITSKIAPFRLQDGSLGRIDMDALYFHSRELRGLDPSIDERPMSVAGFMTVGEAMDSSGQLGATR